MALILSGSLRDLSASAVNPSFPGPRRSDLDIGQSRADFGLEIRAEIETRL